MIRIRHTLLSMVAYPIALAVGVLTAQTAYGICGWYCTRTPANPCPSGGRAGKVTSTGATTQCILSGAGTYGSCLTTYVPYFCVSTWSCSGTTGFGGTGLPCYSNGQFAGMSSNGC